MMAVVVAAAADTLADSFGVVTHLDYSGVYSTRYTDVIKPRLDELNVRHLRDGLKSFASTQMVRARELASLYGVKMTALVTSNNISTTQTNLIANLAAINAVEGPNETNIYPWTYNGVSGVGAFDSGGSTTNGNGVRGYQQDLFNMVNANTQLANLPVVQTSVAPGGETYANSLGSLAAYADVGNFHSYTQAAYPPEDKILSYHLPYARKTTPGTKPLWSTEGGTGQSQTTPALPGDTDASKYNLRILMEQFRLGVKRSFAYELIDQNISGELNYGMLRFDGTPKPVFTGMKNLIALTGEATQSGSDWIAPTFTPGSLDYTITGGTSSVRSTLLQKSDGRFYLVIWQGVKDFYGNGTPVSPYPTDQTVTLSFNTTIGSIKTYRPMLGTTATTGDATWTNIQSITLKVPDQPLVVEIQPTLFNDNFSNGLSNWTPVGGTWAAEATRNGRTNVYTQSNTAGTSVSLAGSSSWTDYSTSAWVNVSNTAGSVGILGRVQNSTNFYGLVLSGGQWKIFKTVSGTVTILGSGAYSYTANTWHRLSLSMVGTNLTASVSTNGSTFTSLGSATDSTFTSGKVGLRSSGAVTSFDDILVRPA